MEVFSITKLAKIVKKTSTKTSSFGSRHFCGDYNGTLLLLKRIWRSEVLANGFLRDVLHGVYALVHSQT